MTKMTYAEKLARPEWQKKRLEIMERDGFRCQRCSSTIKTLHVHHRFYLSKRMPWEYDNAVFVTLCADCHLIGSDDIAEGRTVEGLDVPYTVQEYAAKIPPAQLWSLVDIYRALQDSELEDGETDQVIEHIRSMALDGLLFKRLFPNAENPEV